MKTIKLKRPQNTIRTSLWKFNAVAIILLFSYRLCAQDTQAYLEKYKNYTELQTVYNEEYHIGIDKDNKLNITLNQHEELLVLTDKASAIRTTESVVFSDLLPLVSYEAYTLNNVNNKEKKTKIAQVNDRKYNRNNVFDSDVKLKEFTFANLVQGSKKVIKHEVFFKDPFLLHRFNIGVSSPSVKRMLTINYPDNVTLDYKIFNIAPEDVKVEKKQKGSKRALIFTVESPQVMKYDSDSPGILYEMPHLHFWITEYTVSKETHKVLGTTDKLYDYYRKFIGQINVEEHQELKDFTRELVKNDLTDLEKLKRIFNWVQKNIKYIAFESGYEGFIPREASEVYSRKYGDCKDMASIICDMARYAGIPNVHFTWIGSRELPYRYSELPTLAVDNHMIASYTYDKGIIYLDATDAHVPFGLPSGFIQGKEALIAKGDLYTITKVPEVDAEENAETDVLKLSLDNQKLKGSGTYTSNGLLATNYRNAIGDDQRMRNEFVKELVGKGNDKFKLIRYTEEQFDNDDKPYSIQYDFELDNYVVRSGADSYVNLPLNKSIVANTLENNRMLSFDLEMLQKQSHSISLALPQNTEVVYVPENVSFENELLKYVITYEKSKDEIVLKYETITRKTIITPREFALWNATLKTLKEHLSENIILKNNEKN